MFRKRKKFLFILEWGKWGAGKGGSQESAPPPVLISFKKNEIEKEENIIYYFKKIKLFLNTIPSMF
jgi:hypothetical protein